MADIVDRLRLYARQFEDQHAPEQITLVLRAGAYEIERQKAEISSLLNLLADARTENIQMRFALGYPMPADLERHVLPSNPFKCGVCDARRKAERDAIFEADRELI